MEPDVPACRPIQRLAELPTVLWLGIYVLLYLCLSTVSLVLWDRSSTSLADTLLSVVVGLVWMSPLVVFVSLAATFCLGVLRLLSDARWYWFRLAAVLLFAVPFPLFLLFTSGPESALPVAGAQLATALLIVQPRKKPGEWADRDPAMGDYR